MEAGANKCAAYMPYEVGQSKRFVSPQHPTGIRVELLSSENVLTQGTNDTQIILYKVNHLRIQRENAEDAAEVKHIEFLGWPDHGVPNSSDSFINFLEDLRELARASPAPVVVHCSAGVGRTGTTIVLSNLLSQLKMLCEQAQNNKGFRQRDIVAEAIDAAREQRCCSKLS